LNNVIKRKKKINEKENVFMLIIFENLIRIKKINILKNKYINRKNIKYRKIFD